MVNQGSKGSLQDVPTNCEIIYSIQGTYDIVDRVWMIRILYQGERWLTWSKYGILSILGLRI